MTTIQLGSRQVTIQNHEVAHALAWLRMIELWDTRRTHRPLRLVSADLTWRADTLKVHTDMTRPTAFTPAQAEAAADKLATLRTLALDPVPCDECGQEFQPANRSQRMHRECAHSRKSRLSNERQKVARRRARPTVACAMCSTPFEQVRATHTWCSDRCRNRAAKAKKRRPETIVECTICGTGFVQVRTGHHICSSGCREERKRRQNAERCLPAEYRRPRKRQKGRQCVWCGGNLHTTTGRPLHDDCVDLHDRTMADLGMTS